MEMKRYRLGDLMEVTRGMSLSGEYYATKGELMRLTLGNFDYRNNCFKNDTSKSNLYFMGDVKDEFILNKGDIITPLTEQAIGLLGSTAKIPCGGKYIQSQDVALITCNEKLCPDFAFYLIPSRLVRKQLDAAAQQTKIRHTSPDKIKDCIVWIPEYAGQEKIGKLLSSLDDKIALNRRMNEKLEAMAKRLYDRWFVQFDFPDADGRPYKTSGGKMAWSTALKREIPAGWEVDNLYHIAEYVNGLACQNCRPRTGEDFLPVIKIKEMHDGITTETEKVSANIPEKYKVFDGDILFSWSASLEVMFWCGGDGGLNQHIFKVIPKTGFSKEFVFHQLSSYIVNFQKMAEARKTTMGHITSDHIHQSRIVLPPSKKIEKFSKICAPLYEKIFTTSKEVIKLTALRDRLLPLLMNGQVAVG